MFCSCFIPQQMFPLRSSIAVARQWMDLQIVDSPSDLCGFSQRLVGFRLPDDSDRQVLKWMPSEYSLPKYGDVALNNGMFRYANC